MKQQYRDKISKMHKGSDSHKVILMLIAKEGEIVTPGEIERKLKFKRYKTRAAIANLRASGWAIDNVAENGFEAQWILRGVGHRSCGKSRMFRPKLHPIIESVFC